MGLRINTNIPSVTALRNLRLNETAQRKSLERLSTGLRINRASDDPAGLVISEQLRSQLKSMGQALENSQNASNLVATSEAALQEVSDLLSGLKESIVFALNSGGNDADQIAAEQDAIDNALSSINRVAQTTKFGTRKLLDGSAGFDITATSGEIVNVNIQNAAFEGQTTQSYTLNVTTIASQAGGTTLLSAAYAGASAAGATFRISGANGTQDLTVGSSTSVADFNTAVNTFTSDTGVYASAGLLYSTEFGSDETISIEVLSGTLNATAAGLTNADGVQTDTGSDLVGDLDGIQIDADGYDVRVVSDTITGDIRVSDGTDGVAPASGASYTFTVANSGLVFQLNSSAAVSDREQVGFRSIQTTQLGSAARTVQGTGGNSLTLGGFLSTLESGKANDLNSNAQNALRIVDDAINQVSDLRAYIGAFQANTVDTNVRSLTVALENLTASESTIRDLDFAAETAEFTRSQIVFQSGIAVLAQSNLISQSVLTLLG